MKIKYKLLTCFGMLALFFIFLPMNVFAYEKSLSVTLENSVGEAVFQFTFDDGQPHDITITDPDGKQFFQTSEEKSVSVSVSNAQAGAYSILITGQDAEINMTGAKVVVNKTPAATVSDSGVTVSSVLTDLKIFFMDGVLYVTWKDTNVGSVNVSVTNPKNMQKIDSSSVSGTIYSFQLSDSIETVEVYVVPASSAKIAGAGVSYTLDVVRDLPATVNVDEYVLTNQGNATVSLDLQNDFEIVVKNNDNEIYHENLKAGVQDITFPLDAMTNNLVFYVIDDKNNIKTTSATYVKDLVAPVITLTTDYNNSSINADTLTLSGTVDDFSIFQIQGFDITTDEYGRFTFDCPMDLGSNHVVLYAKDDAGNEKTVELNVERVEKKGSPIVIIIIVFLFLAAIGSIVVLLLKKKYAVDLEEEEEEDEYDFSDDEEYEEEEEEKQNKIAELIALVKEKFSRDKEDIVIEKLNPAPKNRPLEKEKKKHPETEDKPHNEEKTKRRNREHNIMDECRKKYTITLASTLGVIVVCFIILFKFVICNTIISSGSMEPTLMTGDYVIINRLAYTAKDINRGDIVSFWSDECGEYLVKRVIGLPGDEIVFRDGYVLINGLLADESAYLKDNIETNCSKSFVVPDGCIFVLGDNRENSYDSRFFENPYISQKKIVGKYLGTIINPFK